MTSDARMGPLQGYRITRLRANHSPSSSSNADGAN